MRLLRTTRQRVEAVPDGRRRAVTVVLVTVVVAWAVLVQSTMSAFVATTAPPASTLTAITLDPFVPAFVTAARTSPTACQVTWTASSAASPPAGLTYDVTDGATTTLASAVNGTSTVLTITGTGVTPAVRVRVGTWTSTASTASGADCAPVPEAPTGLALGVGDSHLVATWTAPADNGSAVTGYTVSATPVGGGAAVTCSATTTTCTLTGLTNGTTYSVTVTATNANGTGPASAAVTATPVAATPLDAVTAPSSAAYGLRKLRSAYSGSLVQVRRSSDNTTADVGFTASGDLDLTALTTFCGSASCYVTRWYDQSGNAGRDAVQATNAVQPRLVNSGVVDTANGRPAIVFSGAQNLGTSSAAISGGVATVTANVVGRITAGAGQYARLLSLKATGQTSDVDNTPSAQLFGRSANGVMRAYRNSVTGAQVATADDVLALVTTVFDGTTNTMYVGSTAGTPASSSGTFAATLSLDIGSQRNQSSAQDFLTGVVSEVTLFPSALSSTDLSSLVVSQTGQFLLPSAPTSVTATSGDGQSVVAWSPPTVTGSGAISTYTATATPGGNACTVSSPATTCTITGLDNGTTYSVSVVATNGTGTGAPSTGVSTVPRPALLTSTNAQLWLDAADPDGDGTSSGTAENCAAATACTTAANMLTLWKDKSGKARNAVQSTPAMAGTYVPPTGGVASTSAVSFSGNGYYQVTGVPVAPDATAFVVAQSGVTPFNTYGWLLGTRSANGWLVHPVAANTSVSLLGMQGTGTNLQVANTVTVSPATGVTIPHLWDGQISGSSSVATLLETDGALSATGTGTLAGGNVRTASTLTLTMGADEYDLAGRRGNGSYREAVVFDRALTATERRTVQEYLARRWNLTLTPRQPTALSATAGDTTANVGWTAPSWNGGSSVTGYTATAVPADGTLSTRTCTSATTSCQLTGLTNGAGYTVTVTATNAIGTSSASTSTSVTPYPSTLLAQANLGGWWDASDATRLLDPSGTSAQTGDAVATWNDRSGNAVALTQATGANRGTATTLNGRTAWLSTAPTFMSSSTSGSFRTVVSAVDQSRAATWGTVVASPANTDFSQRFANGTMPATGGAVVPSVNDWHYNGTSWTNSVTNGAATASGVGIYASEAASLRSGTVSISSSYSGRGLQGTIGEVLAFNRVLTVAERRTVEEYLARKWGATIAPGEPTSPAVVPGNAQAVVSWAAPTWNGGAAITAYTVTASPGGATCSSAGTSCTVTGLANGTAYTFTVTATNSIGVGQASSSVTATPPGPAGTPTAVTLTYPADAQLGVSWTAPASGAPFTGYTVTATPVDGTLSTQTCSAATTSCTVSGLTNGASYAVTVIATNAAGTGTASTAVTGIPYPVSVMTTSATKLWLNSAAATLFTDTGCTTPVSAAGQSVACWKDASANANNLTNATAGQRPTSAATTVGVQLAPSFDGTDDALTASSNTGMPVGTSDSTTFVVNTITAASPSGLGTRNVFGWGALSTAGAGRGTYLSSGAGGTNAVSTTTIADGTYASGVPQLSSSIFSSGSSYKLRVAGRPTVSQAYSYTTGFTSITLGSTSAPPQGPVQEIVTLDSTLSSAAQRTMEEHLARKWGVTITPSAPGAATGTSGSSQATISWTTPSWNGGASVTGYTVTASPGGATCTATAPTTSCTVTGLTNGTGYTFTVTATNSVGIGATSAATATVTPASAPGAPTGVAASAADTTSAVSWTVPASNGGSAVTGYTVTAVPGTAGLTNVTCAAASSPCTLTGLTDGVTYTISVTATNALGTGAASTSVTVIPYPAGVMTSGTLKLWYDGADASTLFAASTCTGAAATTAVGCWKDKSTQANNATQATTAGQPTLATVSGRSVPAFDGTQSQMSLSASLLPTGSATSTTFVAGISTDSSPPAYRTLLSWGTATANLNREFGAKSGAVYTGMWGVDVTSSSWPLNAIQIEAAESNATTQTVWASGTPGVSGTVSTNTGTTAGRLGQDGGSSFWKGYAPEVVVLSGSLTATQRRTMEEYLARKWTRIITPSAPGAVTVSAGGGSGTVSWTAPTWDGGSAVTGYTATASPGGRTCTATAPSTTCTISGLNAGTYTVTVTATNSIGTGPSSAASASFSPIAPSAPTLSSATAGDGQVALTWTTPSSNGGSAITGYRISYTWTNAQGGSGSGSSAVGVTNSSTVTGLSNGYTYSFTVAAINANGDGTASGASTATPYPASVMTGARMRLWLDGADSSTLFASAACTGGTATTTIGCWTDKSGQNGKVQQGTAASQPTLAASASGRSVPSFDGSNDALPATIGALPTGTSSSSTYAVAELTDPSAATSGYRSVIGWGAATSGQSRAIYKSNGAATAAANAYLTTDVTGTTWPTGTPMLAASEFSAGTYNLMTRAVTYGPQSYAFTTGTSGITVSDTSTYPWYGRIDEVLVLNVVLSAAERRQVEEYLTRKWGGTITPAAPTGITALRMTSTTVKVSWTAPTFNGGSTVTSYTATSSPGGKTCTFSGSGSSNCTVTGLTTGTAYTFTVTATNAAGTGPASSASSSVTP